MLELDDIQHLLLTRTPAITGRYEFLSFDDPAGGRAWLSELIPVVESATAAQASMDSTKRWVTLAFTWNGLRALGVPEESLATFPEAFRQGMAARADILGDTGAAHPDNWVGGLAGADLHAVAILFARDDAEHARATGVHDQLVTRCEGVRRLSFLDLNATPEKRIDLFRAPSVGQLEEPNLKQQCFCDGEQDCDDRPEILNRHVTSHRVMLPEPSGPRGDLGISALPYGLAVSP